ERLRARSRVRETEVDGASRAELEEDEARQAIVALTLVPPCPFYSMTSVATIHGLVARAPGVPGGLCPAGEFE
ncbi:MAG: hypothetical protein WBW33_00720, partial [Bryobacteraceae bacterium]